MMKIHILLPIYNEENNLEKLIKDIDYVCKKNELDYLIVAVNDGSDDGTNDLLIRYARKFPIDILKHSRNRGLGETIRDGFEKIADLSHADDILIRMDADCTHDPKYIPDLILGIDKGYDIAVASRFAKGGGEKGLNANRKLISRIANLLFRLLFPIGGVREYTCGFRAYRCATIKNAFRIFGNNFIQLRGLGFCCTLEKLLKLHLLGANIIEVPFVLSYNLKKGQSKMPFNVTVFGYIIMLVLYHWPVNGWKSMRQTS